MDGQDVEDAEGQGDQGQFSGICEQFYNLVIIAIAVCHELSLYIDGKDRLPQHSDTDVGNHPNPKIEQIPIKLRKTQHNDRQVIEI